MIISVYDDDQYVQAALTAGARGYLLKTVDAAELRESIPGGPRRIGALPHLIRGRSSHDGLPPTR